MERPIDEVKRAEAAMRELLKAATELRKLVDLACVQNPEETAELIKAAAALEKEVQRIKDYLHSNGDKAFIRPPQSDCESTSATGNIPALSCLAQPTL